MALYGGTATHDGNGVVTLSLDSVAYELGEAIASAQICLYRTVDVEGVWRYYKLQASTLATPSVPTTNPPTGWTDTEPTYTSGSTNSLYFTDLTVLSDGSWSYSPVSLSSSYEAAKEAYNKAVAAGDAAQNAQTDVDNLGTNFDNFTSDTEASFKDVNESMEGLGAEVATQGTVIAENVTKTAELVNEQGQIRIEIDETKTTLTDINGVVQSEISDRKKYIDFSTGDIVLGENTNTMQVRISNTEIDFMEDNVPIAWISGQKLYITEAEVTKTLKIGNFEFTSHGPNNNVGIRRIPS